MLHAPVRSFQPPRRARSDDGDSQVPERGGIASPSGGGRRARNDDPPPGSGNADSSAAGGEGNNLLSEDSFYRVAVEKIMERERLGAGAGDGHVDEGCASGGGGEKSGSSRSSGKRRPHHEARQSSSDPMVFASPRGAVADRPGRRKVNLCTIQILL